MTQVRAVRPKPKQAASFSCSGHEVKRLGHLIWDAVKELKLSYYIGGNSIIYSIYIPIMVT